MNLPRFGLRAFLLAAMAIGATLGGCLAVARIAIHKEHDWTLQMIRDGRLPLKKENVSPQDMMY